MDTAGDESKAEFTTLGQVPVCRDGNIEIRAQVLSVDGKALIALCKFKFTEKFGKWYPTGKGLYINKAEWKALYDQVDVIDHMVNLRIPGV